MQVFIIYFTSPLFLIVNHLKIIPSLVRREKVGGGRFCNLYDFGLLSIRQPPVRRAERRDKERGRLKRRRIAIAVVGKYDEYPTFG